MYVLIIRTSYPCRALVFSVIGRGKSTQARATLPAEIFEEYIFESSNENHPLPQNAARHSSSTSSSRGDPAAPVLHFCINLTTLLDCLQIFGSTSETTAATLTYSVSIGEHEDENGAGRPCVSVCVCVSVPACVLFAIYLQSVCLLSVCLLSVCLVELFESLTVVWLHTEPGRTLQGLTGGVWRADHLQPRHFGEGRRFGRDCHRGGWRGRGRESVLYCIVLYCIVLVVYVF